MKATQVCIDGWMDKQNVVPYAVEYYSAVKEEENSDICYNMDKPWRQSAKWNKPVTKGLCGSTCMWYLDLSKLFFFF